ncbi:MAG TPA: hypothetical protein VN832_01940 [Stellaceae bacterium]|nr:hypothetical protein [Stellaceae bacterium]
MAALRDHSRRRRNGALVVAVGVLMLWLLLAGETSLAGTAAGVLVAAAAGAWSVLGDL